MACQENWEHFKSRYFVYQHKSLSAHSFIDDTSIYNQKRYNVYGSGWQVVFFFSARIWFFNNKSISSTLCRSCGEKIIWKKYLSLSRLDYKLRKKQLDLVLLCKCQKNNVITNFLNFYLTNKNLQDSVLIFY